MEMQSEMTDGESCIPVTIDYIHGTSISNNCCSVKIVDPSLKAKYLSSNSNTFNTLQFLAVITVPTLNSQPIITDNCNKIYFDSSPPLLSSNSLYLTNSTLLI